MNLKQKLVYMLIGSLFTLAGYFLASLTNNQPPNAHAQDNTTKVFDKIVCKELEVVNKDGKSIVSLGEDAGGSGSMSLYNKEGKELVGIGIESDGGFMDLSNKDRRTRVLVMAGWHGAHMYLHKGNAIPAVSISAFQNHSNMLFYNEKKQLVAIGTTKAPKSEGYIGIYNQKEKGRRITAEGDIRRITAKEAQSLTD